MWRHAIKAGAAVLCLTVALPLRAETRADIAHLIVEQPAPPVLSNLDPAPADLGAAGAALGVEDTTTTGRFLGHSYSLDTRRVAVGDDAVAAAREVLAETRLLLIAAPAETLTAIADLPEAQGALLFNVGAPDMALRGEDCRANLLHTLPSLAMRSDALVQFLVRKRWDKVVMIAGTHPRDRAFAATLERSLTKFGLTLAARKDWVFDADMRRNAAQEVPLFTQDFGDHDVLLIADETEDFGRYVLYNTWLPRPVAGSEGLRPVAWAPVVEQWGAAQLQGRFEDHAGRKMQSEDYAAWAAVRAIGEGVTRTGTADPDSLRAHMLSDAFDLGGFKGRPLTFRAWNGQLRQPIPLVHPRALAAIAPLEGFLHQRTELDTLGLDAPESGCAGFAR